MTAVALDPDSCAALVTSARWVSRLTVTVDGCWLLGYAGPAGYAYAQLDGRRTLAHRIALAAAMGRDLAPGMQAGHRCHDEAFSAGLCSASADDPCQHRKCVNPAHLAEMTSRENSLAGGTILADHASRTHCPAGHPLAGDNLVPSVLAANGGRKCLTCRRENSRAKRAAIAAASVRLGMTQREYTAAYGQSMATALAMADAEQ